MFVLLAAGAGLVSTGYGMYRYFSSGTPPQLATDNNSDLGIPPAPPLPPVPTDVTVKVQTGDTLKTEKVNAKTKEDLLSELKKKLEERREGFELIKATPVKEVVDLIDLDSTSSTQFQI